MTKAQLRQERAYWQRQRDFAINGILNAEQEFITTNAPYPIGTKLQIDDYGTKKDVVIQRYSIDDNEQLIPTYVTLEGKAQFVCNPTIIKEIK